jgi:hypothetical protein
MSDMKLDEQTNNFFFVLSNPQNAIWKHIQKFFNDFLVTHITLEIVQIQSAMNS